MSIKIRKIQKQCLAVLLVGLMMFAFPASALATDLMNGATMNGAEVFSVHCIGCHANGGNIVRWGKNLKQKALTKNGMDSLEAIATIVTNGKNNMSAYRERLTEQQIQDVSAYVLEQAAQGWH
jgi:cytochrome c6